MELNDRDPIEIIDENLDKFFEEDEIIVYHEPHTPEHENHIDIYWIKPEIENVNYSILLTVGMSRVKQNMDANINRPKLIEVAMLVPKEWNFKNYKWKDNEFWPIHHLKTIAKIPTNQNTWLGFGHTISWNNDDSLIPGTGFNSSIILASKKLPKKFINIELSNNDKIYIYSAVPLFPEELDFKLNNSTNELLDKFDRFGVDEIVDIGRMNTCKQKDNR